MKGSHEVFISLENPSRLQIILSSFHCRKGWDSPNICPFANKTYMSWGFHLLSSSLLMSWHKQQSREQLKCVGSCTMGEAWRKLLAPDFGGPAPTSSSRWRASAYGKFFLCLCNYVASEFKTKGVSASMLSPERGFCFSGSLRRTSPPISPPPPMLYRGLLGPAPGQCPADPAPLHASQGAARTSSRPVPC